MTQSHHLVYLVVFYKFIFQFVIVDGEALCGRWNTSHYGKIASRKISDLLYIALHLPVGVWDTMACQASPLNANGSSLYVTRFSQFGHFGVLLVRQRNGNGNC